jgi:hypothetical protein
MKRSLLFLISAFFLIQGCDKKFNTEELVAPNTGGGNISGDTVYVQLNPAWTGFNNPQDIMIGKEPFIYVADTDNNRIVMMNLDGQILGTRSFQKPIALAQDYKLNLFVSAKFDTVISGQSITLNAVFKLNLVAANHVIANAPMKKILPAADVDINNPLREYPSIAVFYDNSFVIARKGPSNSVLFEPDNALLYYVVKKLPDGTEKDTLLGRMPGLDPLGSGVPSANGFSTLISFNNHTLDVIAGLTGNTNFKVEWLHFVSSRDFTGYQNYISPSSSELMTPNKFNQPEGVGLDNAGNIFVVDTEKDSVFKFNPFGDQLLAFGGTDTFNQPAGVAFFNKTLYIADSGNNRILRFVLSTDIR